MKNFYASTIGEISVHPTDKMSFYIGEDDLMVKMYADLLCAHGPLNDVSIKVYDRPELDDLAYKICCMQYSAGEELPNRKNFMKARAERWRAYMNRVRSFCKMAETIEKSTERTVICIAKAMALLHYWLTPITMDHTPRRKHFCYRNGQKDCC